MFTTPPVNRQALTFAQIQQKIALEVLPQLERNRQLLQNYTVARTIKRKIYFYLSLCNETKEYNLFWLIQQITSLSELLDQPYRSWINHTIINPLKTILETHHPRYEIKNSVATITYPDANETVIIEPQYTRFLQLELVNKIEEIKIVLIKEKPSNYESILNTIENTIDNMELTTTEIGMFFAGIENLKDYLINFINTISFLKRPALVNLLITPLNTVLEKLKIAMQTPNTSVTNLSVKVFGWLKRRNEQNTGYTPTQLFLRELQNAGKDYQFNSQPIPEEITRDIVIGNAASPSKVTTTDIDLNSDAIKSAIDIKTTQIKNFLERQLPNNPSTIAYIMTHLHQDAMLSLAKPLGDVSQLLPELGYVFSGQTESVAVHPLAHNHLTVVIRIKAKIIYTLFSPKEATIVVKYELQDRGHGVHYVNPQVEFSGPAKNECHSLFLQALLCDFEKLNQQFDATSVQKAEAREKRRSLPASTQASPRVGHTRVSPQDRATSPSVSAPASPSPTKPPATSTAASGQGAGSHSAARAAGKGVSRKLNLSGSSNPEGATSFNPPLNPGSDDDEEYPQFYGVHGWKPEASRSTEPFVLNGPHNDRALSPIIDPNATYVIPPSPFRHQRPSLPGGKPPDKLT